MLTGAWKRPIETLEFARAYARVRLNSIFARVELRPHLRHHNHHLTLDARATRARTPELDEPRESEEPRSLFGTLPDQEPACPNRITSEAESRRRQEAYGWPRPGECASH